jgi:hypothetical protein
MDPYTTTSNNKVDLLLSQSKWANPEDIPSVMFAETSDQLKNSSSDDTSLEYSYEADQRVAERLDTLLSNIEKRVEASHELEIINARVHDSLLTYHTPHAVAGSGNNDNITSSNKSSTYFGLSLETRERISRTTRTEIENQMVDMHGRSQRQSKNLDDVSRWFGHASSIGLELTAGSHHHHAGKKRRRGGEKRGKIIKGNPATTSSNKLLQHSSSNNNNQMDAQDFTIDDLQTEEGLRKHMEALDRMMSSVRQAATTLHETHQSVLSSRNNKLDEERKALENAEGNWQRQLQSMKAKLIKKNNMYKKQESILTSIKSALRESQLIVNRQAVENKELKEDATALKKQIRRLRRDVSDAEGLQKEKRKIAENKLEETLAIVASRDATIMNLNVEINRLKVELSNASPKIMEVSRIQEEFIEKADIDQRNIELNKRHQRAIESLEQDHDQSVTRLKQQLLRLESGAANDLKRNIRDVERVL